MMRFALVVLAAAIFAPFALVACAPPAQCLALPVCNAGEASSNTPCGANEPSCRKNELCGTTIYCRPGSADGG